MKNSTIQSMLKLAFLFLFLIGTSNVLAQDKFGGLALYTVREDMGKDAKATLRAVADAGYKYIEAAGYRDGKFYNMSPKEFKDYVKSVGLRPVSSHQGGVTLENADAMIADVKAAGFTYFVVPSPPMGTYKYNEGTKARSGAKNMADALSTLGKKCKAAGLKLLYHNHDFEFRMGTG